MSDRRLVSFDEETWPRNKSTVCFLKPCVRHPPYFSDTRYLQVTSMCHNRCAITAKFGRLNLWVSIAFAASRARHFDMSQFISGCPLTLSMASSVPPRSRAPGTATRPGHWLE